jgi:prevent-host-death family protein
MSQRERAIGAFEAKTRLSELLRETERGNTFVLMRRGKAVARLVPIETSNNEAELGELMRSFHKIRARVAKPVNVRELVEEGRRR